MKRREYLCYGGAMGLTMLAGCGDEQEPSDATSDDEMSGTTPDESTGCPEEVYPLDVELYDIGENVEFSGEGSLRDTGDVRVEEAWVQNTAFLSPSGRASVVGEEGEVFLLFEFAFPDYDEESDNRNRFDSDYNYFGSVHAAGDCDGRYRFDDLAPTSSGGAGVFENVRAEPERDSMLAVQSIDADLLGNDAEIVVSNDERNVAWDVSDEFGEQEFAELVIEDLSIEEREDGNYGVFVGRNRTDNDGIGRFVAQTGSGTQDETVWVEEPVDGGSTFTWERELFVTPDGESMFEVTTAFDEQTITTTDD